jgi:hypothetical protein
MLVRLLDSFLRISDAESNRLEWSLKNITIIDYRTPGNKILL